MSAAPEKKKPRIRLAKCSVLFAMGRKDEAEQLLNEVQNVNPDASTQKIIDALKNTDRAMAYEEYQTTEAFFTQFLRNTGFRYPLALLSAHFTLGEVFTKMGRKEEAAPHFAYCTENGGATIYKSCAAEMLNQSAPVPPQA